MSDNEQWRPIPGFPHYWVSDLGNVRSENRHAPKLLSPYVNSNGYLTVQLHHADRTRIVNVHRLVLEAFHSPEPGQQCLHIDGDKLNNRADNLRPGDWSENQLDSVKHGTHHWANKTHCPAGHPYDEENTYVPRSRRERMCRICRNKAARSYRARKAAARGAAILVMAAAIVGCSPGTSEARPGLGDTGARYQPSGGDHTSLSDVMRGRKLSGTAKVTGLLP